MLQRYDGPSRWEFLRELKEHAGERVVLGSGDLFTAQACLDMIAYTGVDGVTVARGAIGNPWIFAQCRALAAGEPLPAPPTLHEQRDVITEHYRLAEELYGPERCLPDMRKFAIKYSQLHPQHTEVRADFCAVKQPGGWRDVLDEVVRRPTARASIRRSKNRIRARAKRELVAAGYFQNLNQLLPTLGASALWLCSAAGAAFCWSRLRGDCLRRRRRIGVQEPRPVAFQSSHAFGELAVLQRFVGRADQLHQLELFRFAALVESAAGTTDRTDLHVVDPDLARSDRAQT